MPFKILNRSRFAIFTPLIIYSVTALFIELGDGVLSYAIPIYLENNLGDPAKMGIVMAISSFAGIIFDILLGKSKIRSSKKFLIWAVLSAILLPMSIIFFPPIMLVFIIQMLIWGLYYELIAFSNFSFIDEFEKPINHAKAWGILSVFKSIAYLVGPLIAGYTVDVSLNLSSSVAISLFLIGFLIFILLLSKAHKKEVTIDYVLPLEKKESFRFEIRAWFVLLKKIWPLYLFSTILVFVDSGFWTIGVLFSEELQKQHFLGEYFLVIYMIPSVFIGFFASSLAKPWGKKRISYICGVLSGLSLFLLLFIQSIPLILTAVFVSSIFLGISGPEISATFEDYVSRLGGFADDMIGLEQTSGSIAYVLGPVFLGFLSSWYGNRITFSIIGFLLMIVSVFVMIVTPRKIKMPQKTLEILEEEE